MVAVSLIVNTLHLSAIGKDVKALKNADGDLSSLPTTIKTNLVGAITEIHTIALPGAGVGDWCAACQDAGCWRSWSARRLANPA